MNITDFSEYMIARINGAEPMLVSRFGSSELRLIIKYLKHNDSLFNRLKYSLNERNIGWLYERSRTYDLPEYYPVWGKLLNTKAKVLKFVDYNLSAIPQIDVLGSWRKEENSLVISSRVNQISNQVPLYFLEPFYSQIPWSAALENKKVLIISPFSDSIPQQISKREYLFPTEKVLPSFDWKILKAPYHNDKRFSSWIELQLYYEEKILEYDFDIALIGNGCWGMTCGAFIKSLNKKAIHMGGALQLLFGIYGERWLAPGSRLTEHNLINKFWVRPKDNEIPTYFKSVEGGCYW